MYEEETRPLTKEECIQSEIRIYLAWAAEHELQAKLYLDKATKLQQECESL